MRRAPRSTGRSPTRPAPTSRRWARARYTVEPQPVNGIMGTPPPAARRRGHGPARDGRLRLRHRDPLTAQHSPYHGAMHLSVALVQLDATDDVAANIATAVALADEAAAGGARLVALPEYLQYRGPDDGFRASARPIPGPHTDPFAEVARRRDAWILVGSTAETSGDRDRPYNTSVADRARWVDRRALSQGPPVRRGDRGRSGRHRVGPGDGRRPAGHRRRSTAPRSACRSATTCASPSSIARSRWPARRS